MSFRFKMSVNSVKNIFLWIKISLANDFNTKAGATKIERF